MTNFYPLKLPGAILHSVLAAHHMLWSWHFWRHYPTTHILSLNMWKTSVAKNFNDYCSSICRLKTKGAEVWKFSLNMGGWILALIVTLALWSTASATSCPLQCRCREVDEVYTVDCSNAGLTTVPQVTSYYYISTRGLPNVSLIFHGYRNIWSK